MSSRILTTCGFALLVACTAPPPGPAGDGVMQESALGRTIERDPAASVQTERLVYHLQGEAPMYRADIPFTYRNDTGREISIVHCRGGLNMGLEKRVAPGEDWETFYEPALLMCLSPPLVIPPGEVFRDTARIHGALPGHDAAPEFGSADLEGEYRLAWGNLVHDYDHEAVGGEPVGPLRSNPFLLVAPR
jgi:hypothetical protein